MSAASPIFSMQFSGTFSTGVLETLGVQPIDVLAGGFMDGVVVARRISDGAVKIIPLEVGWKRDSGAITIFNFQLLNAKGTLADLASLALVSIDIDADGSDLRVRVKGIASQEIDWAVRLIGPELYHTA